MISPIEHGILSKDKHLNLATTPVPLCKVATAMGVATDRSEKRKKFVSLRRPPLTQEFEYLPPQIDLILHRV